VVSVKVLVPVLIVLALFVAAGIYGSMLGPGGQQTSSTRSTTTSTSVSPSSSTSTSSAAFTMPSSCHSVNGLPDPACTPGATNPDVTQTTIQSTICVSGYTASIRPPTSYTNPLKLQSIQLYGYADTNPADYEEDHLIALEVGGNPTAVQNLWAEPSNGTFGSTVKDTFENYLHSQVCSGAMALAEAQREISTNWVQYYSAWKGISTTVTSSQSTTSSSSSSYTATTGQSLNVTIGIAHDPITRGSVQNITVYVRDSTGPLQGIGVHIHVLYASGSTTKDYDCTTSSAGSCSYPWTIGGTSNPGTFQVTVTVAGQHYYKTFQVLPA